MLNAWIKAKSLALLTFLTLSFLTGCVGVTPPQEHITNTLEKPKETNGLEKDTKTPRPIIQKKSQETNDNIVQPAPLNDTILQDISAEVDFTNHTTENQTKKDNLNIPRDNSSQPGSIYINMEDAEIYDVLLFFIKILDLNCIIEPDIAGKITIHTATPLNKEDLLPLFYQVLEANNLTAVQEGNFYRIINSTNAIKSSLPFSQANIAGGGSGMQIQIIPLNFIDSEEMTKILTPFISESGSLVSHEKSRSLLLIDDKQNIDKVLKIIKVFDVNIFDSIKHQFYHLKYGDSAKIGETLSQVLEVYTKDNDENRIIVLEKLNSLFVLSNNESLFRKVEELLQELDQQSNEVEQHIYIYFLKNSQAGDMSSLLNGIFQKSDTKDGQTGTQNVKEDKEAGANEKTPQRNMFSEKKQVRTPKQAPLVGASDYGSGALRGTIQISEDTIRNALIIEAIPSDYRLIEKVLQRLDILPRQVLISVKIIDVQLNDDLQFGVEWNYHSKSDGPSEFETFINAATGSGGLALSFGEALRWDATISALAQKQKIDIVATPTVLASDNIAASIDISTEVPVATSQFQNDETNTIQTDIQYRDTGIILKVTPHINEYGLVSMDVSQEVSEQSTAVQVGETSYPSFFKRSVQTTLTVNSGQTIAIGGLIREVKGKASSGVPFLSSLPFIGWIFGTQGTEISKSELIILLSPRVIATPDDIDAVTEEFSRKSGFDHNLTLMQ